MVVVVVAVVMVMVVVVVVVLVLLLLLLVQRRAARGPLAAGVQDGAEGTRVQQGGRGGAEEGAGDAVPVAAQCRESQAD